ncbi:MAG TPA: XcyI family restriction endonuclease [Chloroflexi bacterium]|nr:XcyI family restriction endonuclease [Chloroflexota bacterium]
MAALHRGQSKHESWSIDQITKSEFFHQKLHEYGLLEVAYAIEQVQGEHLDWNREDLGISENAWNKAIHRGIKPVRVFAHPYVLQNVHRSVGYYQKLAMVSLKSMNNIGLSITSHETGRSRRPMGEQKARDVSRRLNELISRLVESDDTLDPREFDLWRGMTAGSTAQGSWQNRKGDRTEDVIKGIIMRRIRATGLLIEQSDDGRKWQLEDGRTIEYGSEPDLAVYDRDHSVLVAVEIKGGIDTAGVLERIGAVIKSLSRAKQENAHSITVLIIPRVSMTEQAEQELAAHRSDIDHWFAVEDMLNREDARQQIFELLGI